MQKKYVVRLTEQEREELRCVIKKLKGTGQKVRRAQILLKVDAAGPNWTDERVVRAHALLSEENEIMRQGLDRRSENFGHAE